jgi:predicted PurR-regulated permease PerM
MNSGIIGIIDAALKIVTNTLIPLAFALCLLYFFWGVAKYIRTGAGSEEAAKEGKKVMIWGIVGLFVAFSIWGIISFIQSELGIGPIRNAIIQQK